MFTGYLAIGGREVGNRRRSYDLVRQAELDARWLRLPSDEPDETVQGDPAYTPGDMQASPWYDPDVEASSRFYGFYPIAITEISDSTWQAEITESLGDGGTISKGRYAARQVRVRGFLTADREDALELGMSWLQSVLEPGRCEIHASACGEQDVMWYAAAPRPRFDWETQEDYSDYIKDLRRYLHGVKAISGPLVIGQYRRGNTYGYEIEFTLGASDPHVYTRVITPNLVTSRASTVLASPYNLVKYPSAQAGLSSFVVSRNLVTNPSFETNATGWWQSTLAISGADPTPYFSGALSTVLKAAGNQSWTTRIIGNGSTAASGVAWMRMALLSASRPDISAYPDTTQISITAWAAGISSTVGSISGLRLNVLFLAADNVTIIEEHEYLATNQDGYTWQETLRKPPGAARIALQVSAQATWQSSATAAQNSDIRLYLDAVAITVP